MMNRSHGSKSNSMAHSDRLASQLLLTWNSEPARRWRALLWVSLTVLLLRPDTGRAQAPGERVIMTSENEFRLAQYLEQVRTRANTAQELDVEVLTEGNSSKKIKPEAIQALPLNLLHPTHRSQVSQIVNSSTLFRRLPTVSMQVEPAVHEFFARHPEVAVSMWRVMGISEFSMQQVKPGRYQADAGDGTRGQIDVVYQTANECVAICDGLFQPSLPIKPIRAQCVMHLECSQRKLQSGAFLLTHRIDLFVSFPSQPVKVAAKIVSPLGNSIMDKNFIEVSRFVKMMSLAMERRPDWVETIGKRMEGITPQRRQEFLNLVIDTFSTVRKRHVSQFMRNPVLPTSSGSAAPNRSRVYPANRIGSFERAPK